MKKLDAKCLKCDNIAIGTKWVCEECAFKGWMKTRIRTQERDKEFQKFASELKPSIRKELHEKILKEILDEQDAFHAVSDEKLCPCGHEHKPRSDGRGLRTYCVKGSQCNSDKCKEFVSVALSEGVKNGS